VYAAAALAAAARAVAAMPAGRRSAAASAASLASSDGCAEQDTAQLLLDGGGGGGGTYDDGAAVLPSWRSLIADFASGSAAMLARSLTLQVTFFTGVAVAARFGTAALAAHGVIHQLWMLSAYALDGFETAATVLGVRVAALGERGDDDDAHGDGDGGGGHARTPALADHPARPAARAYARLAARCVGGAAVGGAVLAGAIASAGPAIVDAFLRPGAHARALLAGAPLTVLAAAQPVNGAAYAVDGLLASMHAWGAGAWVMLAGFGLCYGPLVAAVARAAPGGPGVAGIWAAKVALNCVRVGGGLAVVWRAWGVRLNSVNSTSNSRTSTV
jgi:hypothetical protein